MSQINGMPIPIKIKHPGFCNYELKMDNWCTITAMCFFLLNLFVEATVESV